MSATQPHFIAHRDGVADGMTLDPYAKDPAGPFMEVQPASGNRRRAFRRRGDAAAATREGLLTLQRQLDVGGRRGTLTITDAVGIVRASYNREHPEGRSGVGTDLRGPPYPDHLAPGDVAVYSRQGRLVPIERLVAIRALDRYPLRIPRVLALDDVLGSARTHVWLIGLAGIGATGLMAILTLLLSREVWRRTKREIELAYDRDRLRLAQAQIEADRSAAGTKPTANCWRARKPPRPQTARDRSSWPI